MPFCSLNGWTIPLQSADETIEEIGSQDRAFSGTMLIDRRAIKRSWKCVTRPLSERDAEALKGLVLGRGHVFPLTSHDYSDKGLANTGTAPSYRPAAGADGDASSTDTNGTDSYCAWKFSPASAAAEEASTNDLAAVDRDCEGSLANFTATGGATTYASTAEQWEQSKSIGVIGAATPDDGVYVDIDPAAYSSGHVIAGSVYIKPDPANAETGVVRVGLVDVTNAAETYIDVTLQAGVWVRAEAIHTLTGDTTNVRLWIRKPAGMTNLKKIVLDAFQIEDRGSGGYEIATSWSDGARSATDLTYSATWLTDAHGMTLAGWFRMSRKGNPVNTGGLFDLACSSLTTNRLRVWMHESADRIEVDTYGPTGTSDMIPSAASWTDDEWHHVAVAYRRSPEAGEYEIEIYLDGALSGYETIGASKLPVFLTADPPTTLVVASDQTGSYPLNGQLTQVIVVPWAAPAALIAAWAARTTVLPQHPWVHLAGDIVPDPDSALLVVGRSVKSTLVKATVSGTHRTNLRRVEFEVAEV